MDNINQSIGNDIDKLFDKINIKKFLDKPDKTIDLVTRAIITRIFKNYIKKILGESKEFVHRANNESKEKA